MPAAGPSGPAGGSVRSRGLLICGIVLAVVSLLAIAAGAIAAVISLN